MLRTAPRRVVPSILLAIAATLALTGRPDASTIDLSWDRCAPLVLEKAVAAGSMPSLYVTVTGHTDPHRAYEFFITCEDADGQIPDAWRFDVGGCQPAGAVSIEHLWPDMIKSCPAFQGANQSIQNRGYEIARPFLGLDGSPMVMYLANSYPAGVLTPSPTTRYALGRILFDHANSVPEENAASGLCGGLARSMCLTLIPSWVHYLLPDGTQRSFDVGNGTITMNGSGCLAVPAAATTWGLIKGQYRR